MNAKISNDTHPAVAAILIAGYRGMSANDRLQRVRALTRSIRALALADVRRRFPDVDAREQALLVASRWIEPGLMRRAFGWPAR